MAVGAPETSPARLELLKRWHQNREEQRSWEPSRVDAKRYRQELGSRHASAMEFTFSDRQSGALVGVGIWDRMPDALSAVYFYYDPAYGKYSLGVLNVLRGIALAKAEGLRYVYLGYRVLGCPSLRYKSSFRPHETLVGRPMPEDAPRWEAEAMNIADDGGVQS